MPSTTPVGIAADKVNGLPPVPSVPTDVPPEPAHAVFSVGQRKNCVDVPTSTVPAGSQLYISLPISAPGTRWFCPTTPAAGQPSTRPIEWAVAGATTFRSIPVTRITIRPGLAALLQCSTA